MADYLCWEVPEAVHVPRLYAIHCFCAWFLLIRSFLAKNVAVRFAPAFLSRLIRCVVTYAFHVSGKTLTKCLEREETTWAIIISELLNQIRAILINVPTARADFGKNEIHVYAVWILETRLKLIQGQQF